LKILVLSFYFEPDLCAGSFRTTALVKEIQKRISSADTVNVLTTMPNRYHSYKSAASSYEKQENVTIRRIALPQHKSGMLDQSKSFTKYALSVLYMIRVEKYDLIFATSSRLLTAFLGSFIARRKKTALYLDIRDIFPDTLKDLTRKSLVRFLVPIFGVMERYTIKSACRVNLVSKGFAGYFKNISPDTHFSFLTNGIDDEFLGLNFQKHTATDKKIILYAGNIGEGQGLEKIIPDAAILLNGSHEFWVVGDGGTKEKLQSAISKVGTTNVKLMAPVNRKELIGLYAQSDYLFLHLNDFDAFKKVLPSKIFEYAATGKPFIAGVAGYSRQFIEKHVENSAVFKPCEADDCIEKLKSLNPEVISRDNFIQQFSRQKIMQNMAQDILKCLPET
jgi:glycosyltransferase involved in cell wall biosynthesis